jgi:drug/metabolite transporter (DMT)-like permease
MVAFGAGDAQSKLLGQRLGVRRMLFTTRLIMSLLLAAATIPNLPALANWRADLAALAIGLLGYIPVLAFMHGIRAGRVGLITPIAGSSPLITVLLSALFLHIPIHPGQWLAIVAIVAANALISLNFNNAEDSSLSHFRSGVTLALIAAILWGLVYFLIIFPTRVIGPAASALWIEVGVALASGAHLFIGREKPMLREVLNPHVWTNALIMTTGALAYTVGVAFFNIGIVAVLSNSSAIAAILVAAWFFRERLSRKEKILAGALVAGVALLSFS